MWPEEATLALSQFIDLAFGDLASVFRGRNDLYRHIFFNRDTELRSLVRFMSDESSAKKNLLITGDAGVGKTNFIHRALSEDKVMSGRKIIIVDWRNVGARDVNLLTYKFLSDFMEYLHQIGIPNQQITITPGMSQTDQAFAFLSVHDIVNSKEFSLASKKTPLVIICDDFDYLEQKLTELLPMFQSFINSPDIKFIMAARPYLTDVIKYIDDQLRRSLLTQSEVIKLKALDCLDVVGSRLQFILKERTHVGPLGKLRLESGMRELVAFFQTRGIDLTNIGKIDFPLSVNLVDQINSITDGNIREMFDITKTILNEYGDRLADVGAGIIDLTRSEFLDLFLVRKGGKHELYKIDNINEYMNKKVNKNNSLFCNVLQAIQDDNQISGQVEERLREMGHSNSDVDMALRQLSHQANRYIVHRTLNVPLQGSGKPLPVEKNWLITKKGIFYLEMAQWDEYTSLCGHSGDDYQDYIV